MPKTLLKQFKHPLWRISGRIVLLGFGLAMGFLGPYFWRLDQLLEERLGQLGPTPSTELLARPLTLANGQRLSLAQLEFELNAAAYARDGELRLGSYQRDGNQIKVRTRRDERIEFQLSDGAVQGLRVKGKASSGAILDSARLGKRYQAGSTERTILALESFPVLLVSGIQAVEDRRFSRHHGIDWIGVARASATNVRARRVVEGGSTLTQQLVKSLFFNGDRRWVRKVHEAALALLMEWRYDKATILHGYLNEVFLGQSGNAAVHGFEAAAQFYFGLSAQQLGPHQIGLLIGLLKGPSHYNPWRHPERAKQRRNIALKKFYDTGLISNSELIQLSAANLDVLDKPALSANRHPAFVDLVRHQVNRASNASIEASSEGLTVQTTLSTFHQAMAEKAVREGLAQIEGQQGSTRGLQAALVLVDRSSGDVLAAVGGREVGGFNRVLNARRPIGSIVKPFVFRAALRDGYTLASRVEDRPLSLRLPNDEVWSPANFSKTSHGSVPLIEALAESYNQATARLGLDVGVDRVLAQINALGWHGHAEANPSLVLGAIEMTPLEVAQLYLSLGSDGRPRQVNAVAELSDASGVRFRRRMARNTALSSVNYLMSFALHQAVRDGTGRGLGVQLGQGIAGKTGTSNDLRDSWFVGWSADLLAVVWVGRDDNQPAGVSGATGAMQVFGRLFQSVPWQPDDPPSPASIEYAWIDRETGKLAANHCADTDFLPFIEGTTPIELAPCLEFQRREPRRRRWWRFWR